MSLCFKSCILRHFIMKNAIALRLFSNVHVRSMSSSPKTVERITVTDDGSTVVCWHPEQPFPYECSRPIIEERVEESNSVLKVQNLSAVYEIFKPKSEEQTRADLMKLTSSTKHIWFPPGKKVYKKKKWPRDREYL